ncbi:MAG: cation diffusion facilitator family transporter [Pirellulales bacterium]|nr:cation diffusion facilitator family transporter [Pirellulales bacterium]
MASPLQRNAILGLVASLGLAGAKLVAGVVGHSTALVADAVESLADSVGSIVVWQGLRVADRPPDRDHPYGYGRAEAVAALVVGGLLLLAATLIVVKAFGEMMTPHQAPAAWTLLVLLVVLVVKEGLFRLVLQGAEEFASDAARADAWHHRSDAITSAAALVGVTLAVWGPGWFGYERLVLADEAAAILASGIIVLTGVRLIRPALGELLDAVSHELAADVRRSAAQLPDVRLIEKVHARKSGRGYHIDLHLHVPPDMDVRTAHALAGKVKAHIRAQHPSVEQVLIHIEPAEE